jgi:hypothetical protein
MSGLAVPKLRAGAAWVFYWTMEYARCIAGYRMDSATSTNGASSGPDQVKPGRLMRYAIGTMARPPLGDFPPCPYWDGPLSQVIRHSTRLAPQPFGEAGLSSGSVSRRTRRRTEAGGPGGATGRDSILQRRHANLHLRVWGLEPTRR